MPLDIKGQSFRICIYHIYVDFFQSKTTKVYVTNLPDDINDTTFLELMSKCGVVDVDVR